MRYIDAEKIYELTDHGKDIFSHYFPGEEIGSNRFIRVRPEDKTPSAKISWYNNLWRITDFGNQDQLNSTPGIQFVRYRENCNYYEALLFIEQVIIKKEITSDKFSKPKWSADYEYREMTSADKKGEYKFTFKKKPSADDLAAIGRYVTEDILDKYHCKVVESYSYCSASKRLNKDVVHIFKSNKDYPIFLFDYGTFKKLYRPHEQEKNHRFVYVGKKPTDYIYGLEQILECKNEFVGQEEEQIAIPEDKPEALVRDIFRCSGESDALNLASLGFHVYWLNSESATLDYKDYKRIDTLCENHYQIMDLDSTGRNYALINALKHISLYTVELPEWLQYKKDFRENPCKDLKDFINLSGEDREQTCYDFLVLKRASKRVKFWHKTVDEKTKKVNYSVNMEFFYFFLKANGFYQVESIYHKKAGYSYAQVKGRIVDLISPDAIKRVIKRFTKDWIKGKKLMDCNDLLNKINTSNQITEANLETIDEIKLNFKNYSSTTEYLNFLNGSLKVTRDKIEMVKHEQLPNYILGKLEIDHNTISHLSSRSMSYIKEPAIEVNASKEYQQLLDKLAACKTDDQREIVNVELAQLSDLDKYEIKINDKDFIFIRFLRDLSRIHWRKELERKEKLTADEEKEENLLLANLLFVLGYHCSQYKDPSKPWFTLLQDMKISAVGQSSGRSGKSLLSMAVTFVRTSFYKGGRTLDNKNEYQFFYDGFTEFHDFIEIDDMHEYADFGFFYTQVTGKREINPKNYAPFTLEYGDSGKMLISSNFELQNIDSSTIGRMLNCGVSDYYHEATKFNDYKETRTPLLKFGRRLYDDFTAEEWVKFYNLIAYCIQLQMRFYKIQPPMMNLEKRQLRRAMSQGLGKDEDFFHWANDYFTPMIITPPLEYSPADTGYFNTFIFREYAFNAFLEKLTKKQAADYRSNKFKTHLQSWCDYYGYTLNPEEMCTGDKSQRRILKTIERVTRECFFISTRNIIGITQGSELSPESPDDQPPF